MTDRDTIPVVEQVDPEPAEATSPVLCQCMESGCVCVRLDPELDYRTSSWLVCQACCENRHVWSRHKHVYRCECGRSA